MTENFLNLIKQPAPSVGVQNNSNENEVEPKKQQRSYNMPKVGVVDVPYISKTPVNDTIEIKRQENPHTVYKLLPKKINVGFQNMLSLGVFACGIGALIGLLKK